MFSVYTFIILIGEDIKYNLFIPHKETQKLQSCSTGVWVVSKDTIFHSKDHNNNLYRFIHTYESSTFILYQPVLTVFRSCTHAYR